jgi:hypothetical protein
VGGVGVIVVGMAGVLAYFALKKSDLYISDLKKYGQPRKRRETVSGKEIEVIEFEYFNTLIKSIRQTLQNREQGSKEDLLQKRLQMY